MYVPDFNSQEQDVQRRPYSRSHQEKLSSFRQEINCILQVLEDQSHVVQQLLQSFYQEDDYVRRHFGARREATILQECVDNLGDRISNFTSLEQHARDLIAFVSNISLPSSVIFLLYPSPNRQHLPRNPPILTIPPSPEPPPHRIR